MALAQLNLKLPSEVLADWRRRAAEAGHGASVRDWLLSIAGPTVPPGPAPAGGDGLADRVAQLEATTAALGDALAQLRAGLSPCPRPIGAASSMPAAESLLAKLEPIAMAEPAPLPERRLTAAEAEGLVTLPDLVEVLGLAGGSAITNWIKRESDKRGGSAVGAVYRGHRLRGKGLLPGGQKPGWLFEHVTD